MMQKNPIKNRSKKTTRVLLLTAVVFFIFLSWAFFRIAIIKNVAGRQINKTDYTTFLNRQNIQPNRGSIFASDGTVLAEETTTYKIYAVISKKATSNGKPAYVIDKEQTAKILAKYIDLDEKKILKRLKTKNAYQVEFGSKGNNLSIADHDKIQKEKLTGIGFTANKSRFYPNGSFAPHTIGYTHISESSDGLSSINGIMGIEQSFNKQLKGKSGVFSTSNTNSNKVENGDNVYLTLDFKLQQLMDSQMATLGSAITPEGSSAVLMDAKTGKILAASQYPTFDPNSGEGIDKLYSNLLYQNAFEPGSVIKGLTLATAIQKGVWDPNQTFQSGTLQIANSKVTDLESNMGIITYREGFARSSNVGFALTEQRIGDSTWKSYIKKFGLLKAANTEFIGEDAGVINSDSKIATINTAFGQGITATPMQMIKAYSAIANNGKTLEPYIVDKVTDENNNLKYQGKIKWENKVVSKTTAKKVRNAMVDVVNMDNATGRLYSLSEDGYQIAAKTGTAQIAVNGQYSKSIYKSTYSVISMVPAEDPKYVFFMYIKSPSSFIGGSGPSSIDTVMRPVLLQALNNTSSKSSPSTLREVPDVLEEKIKTATEQLESLGFNVSVLGNGDKVQKQSVDSGSQLLSGNRIFLSTGGQVTMPNMKGWTSKDVLTFASLIGAKVEINGGGYVSTQSISSGENINEKSFIKVELK